MKHILGILIVLATLIACAPTPTVMSLPTATALITTTLPTSTATALPTETRLPTSTPTMTPSPTSSPTITSSPTPTEVFKSAKDAWNLVWSNDFENGMGDFSGINIKGGGVLSLIPDFTNSGRGIVLKGTIQGPLVREQGEWKRRAQPERYYNSWYDPKVMLPPIATGVDLWFSKDFAPTENRWVNALGIFSTTATGENRYIVGVHVRKTALDKYRLVLSLVRPNGTKIDGILVQDIPFEFERWYKLEVRILDDTDTQFFVNNQFVSHRKLEGITDAVIGFFGVHSILYAGTTDTTDDFPQGAFALLDNFWIAQKKR